MSAMSHGHDPLDAVVRYFETLDRDSVRRVGEIYAGDAFFKDPFNEARGEAAIRRIYEHMFEQLEAPRFKVTGRFSGDDGAMLIWDMTFRMRSEPVIIRGSTHLRFAPDGRISYHRDYWDSGEELYAKLPVLGALIRFLQRKGRAG